MTEADAAPSYHSRVQELYGYWLSIHPSGGALPGRQHFSPVAVRHLLPDLWLLDVQHDPLRFRYRLIGTKLVERHGQDYTGCWLDEVHPGFASLEVYDQFRAAAQEGRIGWRKGRPLFAYERQPWLAIERIILPLASDGAKVDMLLGLTVPLAAPSYE
jgi:hypothetical protein